MFIFNKNLFYFVQQIIHNMRNSFSFKIDTAIIIFLAIIFRLFVVNAYSVSSPNTSQAKRFLTFHFSTLLKRRQTFEAIGNSNLAKFHDIEVCVENSGRQVTLNLFKSILIPSSLYSLFKRIVMSFQLNNLFDSIKCKLFPKRFLSLSVLRI